MVPLEQKGGILTKLFQQKAVDRKGTGYIKQFPSTQRTTPNQSLSLKNPIHPVKSARHTHILTIGEDFPHPAPRFPDLKPVRSPLVKVRHLRRILRRVKEGVGRHPYSKHQHR
jgi:hypothetical protein